MKRYHLVPNYSNSVKGTCRFLYKRTNTQAKIHFECASLALTNINNHCKVLILIAMVAGKWRQATSCAAKSTKLMAMSCLEKRKRQSADMLSELSRSNSDQNSNFPAWKLYRAAEAASSNFLMIQSSLTAPMEIIEGTRYWATAGCWGTSQKDFLRNLIYGFCSNHWGFMMLYYALFWTFAGVCWLCQLNLMTLLVCHSLAKITPLHYQVCHFLRSTALGTAIGSNVMINEPRKELRAGAFLGVAINPWNFANTWAMHSGFKQWQLWSPVLKHYSYLVSGTLCGFAVVHALLGILTSPILLLFCWWGVWMTSINWSKDNRPDSMHNFSLTLKY